MIEAELDVPVDQSSRSSPNLSPPPRSRRCTGRGWRRPGEDVAVKVLRPSIERAFRKDIDAFYLAARMIEFLVACVAPAAPDRM